MPAYRVYRLNVRGGIVDGHWLEAACDETARAQAAKLCEPGVPAIELWEGSRRLGVVDCNGVLTERPAPQ